jgi:hypothetical protein
MEASSASPSRISGTLFQLVLSPGRSRHAVRQSAVPNATRGFADTLRGQKADPTQNFSPAGRGGQRYVSASSYVFASLIRAKFSDPGKLRRALCEWAFSDQMLKNHPHDLEKTQTFYTHRRVLVAGLFLSELGFGASHSSDFDRYFLHTDEALLSYWAKDPSAVLIIEETDLERLAGKTGTG